MLRNYILIAIRNLVRQPVFSFINIFGLSIGVACSLVIILFVYGELTYEKQFTDNNRIFRIATSFFNIGTFASGPHHLNETLTEYTGIDKTSRVEKNSDVLISVNGKEPTPELVYEVDSTFFNIFDYPFEAGNRGTCLSQPNTVVITESISEKYFSRSNALGETLLVGKEKVPFFVTAIVKNTDDKSHLTAQIWFPFVSNREPSDRGWNSAYTYNYVKVSQGFSKERLEENISKLIKEKVYPFNHRPDQTYEDWIKTDNAYKLFVQPLPDIYLQSKLRSELSAGGNEDNIYIFSGVAILVLILAMVNFVNLSTSRASKRAKEVGLRKTMGTSRGALIGQFLAESICMCLIAFFASLLLAEAFLLGYQLLIGRELISNIFVNPAALSVIMLFTLLVGLLAGLYPAFYITSFQPASVLKGKIALAGKSLTRNALVVVQFTISVSLVICMLTIIKQLNFLQTKDLGFESENILVINNAYDLNENKTAFRNIIEQLPDVVSTSLSYRTPASKAFVLYTYQTNTMAEPVTYNTIPADEKYFETFGMALLQGRNFNPQTDTDSTVAIVNEAAVKDLGLNDPIGTEINKGQKIIAVVRDFHFMAVQQKIEPLVMTYRRNGYSLAVKISGNEANVIKVAEERWKALSPDQPMDYTFIDDTFNALLEKEHTFTKIIIFFSILAIIICSLGLFGLTLYTAEQRVKEVGIRKVMGASVNSILVLFGKTFSLQMLVSIVVALPLSLYFLNEWLAGFAYQIRIGWQVLVVAAVSMTLLSLVTIIGSSWHAAIRNPVDTLRGE